SDDLKRQIGQHFVLGFHSYHLDDNVKALIRDYHVANIILMKRNIQGNILTAIWIASWPMTLFAKESGHQVPLLIGIDQENGLVSAFSSPSTGTQFPGAMALAACGDEAVCMTERVYQAAAQELRLAGIHWTYAPVADVNSDSKNPVIGVRSFGDDPYRVATLTAAALRGLEAGGIAACAKHFPGHGDTAIDSHLALPEITKSEEELKQTELVPFKTLIAAGVPSVMTGHMALPRLTGNDTPSSLSRAVTTGLLRQNLGFSGLVVTDCLEMNAVAMGWGIEEGAVRALQADADVVMICHTFERQKEAIDNVYNAILRDRLDHDALLKSGTRIAAFKERYVGRWESLSFTHDSTLKARWDELKASNLTLSDDAYRRSITVVKDKHHLLPL
ncbi:glycoside hydrolase, partial [Fistulina hepatica ATCC 64428]